MSPEQMAELLDLMEGGRLYDLKQDNGTVRFRIAHKELARKIDPDFKEFFTAFIDCTRFELQPFRNESTVLKDVASIERMQFTIHSAQAAPPHVHLYGVGRGGERDARLLIQAKDLILMDEAYDRLKPTGLRTLRIRIVED
jgi:hypothetical protein